jgi:serine/threonine protein kinase
MHRVPTPLPTPCQPSPTPVQEFKLVPGDVIAERYVVNRPIGSAAFSRAVAAMDLSDDSHPVCLKVIRSNKDFFDQSLDEIKMLQRVNAADPDDKSGIVRLRDFFYWREHLVLVTELLHLNLYQCARRSVELSDPYFTLPRVRAIASQVRCRLLGGCAQICCAQRHGRL